MKTISFQDRSPTWLRAALFVLCVSVFLWFKFSFHELWKDEWQAWLMARDMDWGELFGALYYEGHPFLWYAWLKIWSYFPIADPTAIQLAHSTILVAAFALFFMKFRFPIWLKIGFFFSYFLFFEYGLISRGYAFVMLLGFAAALALERMQKQADLKGIEKEESLSKYAILLGILLFLLCQTEVYGVLIAGGFFVYYFQQNHSIKDLKILFQNNQFLMIFWSMVIGLLFFIISVYPRGSEEELSQAYLENPFAGEVILATFQGNFGKTFLPAFIQNVKSTEVSGFGLLLGFLVLASLIWLFKNNQKILITYLITAAVFWFFSSAFYLGGLRQWGNHFLFFIMLLHLFAAAQKTISIDRLAILAVILVAQLWYSFLGVQKEYQYPFSNAQKTAAFIQEKVPANVPVLAINKFEAASVGGYADRAFYALPEGEPFTYFKWVEKIYLPTEQELKAFATFKNVGGIVIICPKKLDPRRYPNAELWQSFDSYNIKGENYYLYAFKR